MIDVHGDPLDPEDLASFKIGETSFEQVQQKIGSASSRMIFDTQTWIYLHSRQERKAFFKPKEIERNVTIFEFDKEGFLSDIVVKTLAQGREITPAPRAENSNEETLSILDQMISNAGKMGTDTPVY